MIVGFTGKQARCSTPVLGRSDTLVSGAPLWCETGVPRLPSRADYPAVCSKLSYALQSPLQVERD